MRNVGIVRPPGRSAARSLGRPNRSAAKSRFPARTGADGENAETGDIKPKERLVETLTID